MKTKTMLIVIFLFLVIEGHTKENTYSLEGSVQTTVGSLTKLLSMIKVSIDDQIYVLTDSLGRFRFDNLKIGKYELKAKSIVYGDFDTLIILDEHSIVELKIHIKSFYDISTETAYNDISNGEPKLLCSGGIIIIDDEDIEKKYNVQYLDFGCVTPEIDSMINYNKVVFEFLDKKYGTKWRKEVRQDIYGLNLNILSK